MLIGGRGLRRNKLRKLAVAKLLRGGDEDEDETIDEGEGEENQALRMLIGRGLRRRKLRRLALAHLLREQAA